MNTLKIFTPEELAIYVANHEPHRKVLEAQDKEARLCARRAKRESDAAHKAENNLQNEMLHGA